MSASWTEYLTIPSWGVRIEARFSDFSVLTRFNETGLFYFALFYPKLFLFLSVSSSFERVMDLADTLHWVISVEVAEGRCGENNACI